MEYEPPIMEGHAPFLFYIHYSQIDRLQSSCVICKLNLRFGILPDASVEIFYCIGGVHYFADLHGKIKIAGQVIPVILPGLYGMAIFISPFSSKGCQRKLSSIAICGTIISYGKNQLWEYQVLHQNNQIIARRNSDTLQIVSNNAVIPNSYYGKYSGVITDTLQAGSYNLQLEVIGYSPKTDTPYQRNHLVSILVEE